MPIRTANSRILVLADDLTGALEAGALFAGRGVEAAVEIAANAVADSWDRPIPALIFDTETRHLAPESAFRTVRALAAEAARRGFRYIFKKTDSTLRGNIGSEFGAIMAAFPGAPVLYLPAYPQMGRTVVGGKLLVDGNPVTETEFSDDLLNPVCESHIPTLLAKSLPGTAIFSLSAGNFPGAWKTAVYVVDGVTEEDVRSAIRVLAAFPGVRLVAGPAGVARHLVDLMDLPCLSMPALPRIARCLVVNGSRHRLSGEQVHHAMAQGWPRLAADGKTAGIAVRDWMLLSNPRSSAQGAANFGQLLGRYVRAIVTHALPDGIVVFGGDTAFDIMNALGATSMRSRGEVIPGVPITKIEAAASPGIPGPRRFDFYLITKAGGFGPADVLTRVRDRLSGS